MLFIPINNYDSLSITGVNPAGNAGDTPPIFLVGGTSTGITPQYYYVLSASSRFHSAIRRHQFASVRQADSRLTRLVPQPSTRVDDTGVDGSICGPPAAISCSYRDTGVPCSVVAPCLCPARRPATRYQTTRLAAWRSG